MLRGMHHKRIKYHNDLVQELDKNNMLNHEITQLALDKDMDAKVKELENNKNDNNNDMDFTNIEKYGDSGIPK